LHFKVGNRVDEVLVGLDVPALGNRHEVASNSVKFGLNLGQEFED